MDITKMRPDDMRYLALGIPDQMLESMIAYRDTGRPVGDFLQAVFANDLLEAVGWADDTNKYLLDKYAMFVYNELPRGSHGSREAYQDWIEQGEAFQAYQAHQGRRASVAGEREIHAAGECCASGETE